MKILVSRPVNGISINGGELLLEDDGVRVKTFNNESEARDFLMLSGIEKEDLENFNYIEE